MARHDDFNDYYTPEPVRDEDRSLHKWPAGYWDRCDELLANLRSRRPNDDITLVVRVDGGFHVRLCCAGQTTQTSPGNDRIDALQKALSEIR
jgi:hypothetical protein